MRLQVELSRGVPGLGVKRMLSQMWDYFGEDCYPYKTARGWWRSLQVAT